MVKGRVAIVTGAARGMGAAAARLLVAEGAYVVLTDIDMVGAATAKEIRAPSAPHHHRRAATLRIFTC